MTPRQEEHAQKKREFAEVRRSRTIAWKTGGLNPRRTDRPYLRYLKALNTWRANP